MNIFKRPWLIIAVAYSHFTTCAVAFCLQPDPKLAKLDPTHAGVQAIGPRRTGDNTPRVTEEAEGATGGETFLLLLSLAQPGIVTSSSD